MRRLVAEIHKLREGFPRDKEVIDTITELLEILESPERLMSIIREELTAIRDEYGDDRYDYTWQFSDDTARSVLELIACVTQLSHIK